MKKFGILAVSLAAMFALGLCGACGENDSGTQQDGEAHQHTFSQDWSSDETYHWHAATCGHAVVSEKKEHTMSGGKCSVCGYEEESALNEDTDFEALISDRVTEEEWRAVFSDETFKNVTLRETSHNGEVSNMLSDCTDTRLSYHVIVPAASGDSGACVFYEDGIQTMYMDIGGQWYYMQQEMTSEELEEAMSQAFFHFTYIAIDLSDYYKDFTYDEERGSYCYEAPEGSEGIVVASSPFEYMQKHLDSIEVKFKEGRLAYLRWKNYSTSADGERELMNDVCDCYYDYGKTKVVRPENALPYPEG